jgi:hypothetical protein
MSHVDEFAIITNGILTRDDSIYRIIDPLGYFVIQIDEEIVDEDVGGGALDPRMDPNQRLGGDKERKKKKKKIIRITVVSPENNLNYREEIEVQDINVKVKKVQLIDGFIHLTLYNPRIDEITTKKIKVRNVKE